jgi:hypothetical protein
MLGQPELPQTMTPSWTGSATESCRNRRATFNSSSRRTGARKEAPRWLFQEETTVVGGTGDSRAAWVQRQVLSVLVLGEGGPVFHVVLAPPVSLAMGITGLRHVLANLASITD